MPQRQRLSRYVVAIETSSAASERNSEVLRTDALGTIQAVSDGKTVTFTWDNQSARPETPETAAEECYIGNVNSHKFHSPDCPNLPAEQNQVRFSSYEEAVAQGYSPCGNCLG